METKFIIPISIITILLGSGCIEIGQDQMMVGSSGLGETIEGYEEGTGYLTEGNSEELLSMELKENQFVTRMMFILNWYDEDPANRARHYTNYPDIFTAILSNGEHVSVLGSAPNIIDGQGIIVLSYPSDNIDNQTLTRPLTITILLTLISCEDQYPMNSLTGNDKIIDEGNSYAWRLEYEYLDKS